MCLFPLYEGEGVAFVDHLLRAGANWVRSLHGQAPPVTHELGAGRAGAVWRRADFTRKLALRRFFLLRRGQSFPCLATSAILVGFFEFNEAGFAVDLLPTGLGDDLVLGLLRSVILVVIIIVIIVAALAATSLAADELALHHFALEGHRNDNFA